MYAILTIAQGRPMFMTDDNEAVLWDTPEDAQEAAQNHDLFALYGYAILDLEDWTLDAVTGPMI